jgi:hypothetical protein
VAEGSVERSGRQDPGIGGVVLLAVGVAGFTMCLTLLYQGMRDVMDIGGYCAEGGPYVIQRPCPEGTIPATLLGTFGMLLFGAVAMAGAFKVGGYGWLLIAGWTALFAALGWNFLDYGVLNPPNEKIEWGWLIPGVMFELMAWVPAAFVVKMALDARSGHATGRSQPQPNVLRGPSQPAREAAGSPWGDAAAGSEHEAADTGAGSTTTDAAAEQAARLDIARALGAVIDDAVATTPADPVRRSDAADVGAGAAASGDFSEGTQALLDRLERLADMRDRGLLDPDEYETAKEAIVRELETRR